MADVLEELQATLRRAVARFCPHRLRHLREDLVQSAWVRVLAARAGEHGQGVPASYLYKVAYSALIDEVRRLGRRPEIPLEEAPGEPEAAHHNPEREVESHAIGQGIMECLQRLSQDRRLAVTLYLAGDTVAEAAEILGWDLKRTRNLVYRGLADLRACLSAKGLEP